MKKTILFFAVLFTTTAMYAQESLKGLGNYGLWNYPKFDVSVGAEGGMPLGNLKETSKFGIGGTAKLAYNVNGNIAVTFQTGFMSFAGKTEESGDEKYTYPALNFIPFKFGGRYTFPGGFYAEPQIGFTRMSAKGAGGATGFTYAINAGYKMTPGIDISARYEGVSKEGTVSFVGVRAAYSLGFGK
jgi:hypothetical protein